jgi:hypothetical protein
VYRPDDLLAEWDHPTCSPIAAVLSVEAWSGAAGRDGRPNARGERGDSVAEAVARLLAQADRDRLVDACWQHQRRAGSGSVPGPGPACAAGRITTRR